MTDDELDIVPMPLFREIADILKRSYSFGNSSLQRMKND
jgi:hypothetical protein